MPKLLLLALTLAVTSCCSQRHPDHAGANVGQYWFHPSSVRKMLEAQSKANITNAENPRPAKFQVVTGVSTGALLATYAFLGSEQDDALLANVYTNVVTKDIYRKRFILFALFSDSLYKSKPLKKVIDTHISEQTLQRVAAVSKNENRCLYVGTVNHDTGNLVIWDLTRIASDDTNPNRLQLYRDVVFASASIPILVPPVNIDGNLYADGGARAQLFFEKDFFPSFRHLKDAHENGPAHPDLAFHIIVNGQLGLQTNYTSDCLLPITKRTLAMLLDSNELGNLYQIEHVRNRIKFGKIWIAPIPFDMDISPSDEFIPAKMSDLYQAGVKFGQSGKWSNHIPDE